LKTSLNIHPKSFHKWDNSLSNQDKPNLVEKLRGIGIIIHQMLLDRKVMKEDTEQDTCQHLVCISYILCLAEAFLLFLRKMHNTREYTYLG